MNKLLMYKVWTRVFLLSSVFVLLAGAGFEAEAKSEPKSDVQVRKESCDSDEIKAINKARNIKNNAKRNAAIARAESERKACYNKHVYGDSGTNSSCEEARKEFRKSRSDMKSSCSVLGGSNCAKAVVQCSECMGRGCGEDDDDDAYCSQNCTVTESEDDEGTRKSGFNSLNNLLLTPQIPSAKANKCRLNASTGKKDAEEEFKSAEEAEASAQKDLAQARRDITEQETQHQKTMNDFDAELQGLERKDRKLNKALEDEKITAKRKLISQQIKIQAEVREITAEIQGLNDQKVAAKLTFNAEERKIEAECNAAAWRGLEQLKEALRQKVANNQHMTPDPNAQLARVGQNSATKDARTVASIERFLCAQKQWTGKLDSARAAMNAEIASIDAKIKIEQGRISSKTRQSMQLQADIIENETQMEKDRILAIQETNERRIEIAKEKSAEQANHVATTQTLESDAGTALRALQSAQKFKLKRLQEMQNKNNYSLAGIDITPKQKEKLIADVIKTRDLAREVIQYCCPTGTDCNTYKRGGYVASGVDSGKSLTTKAPSVEEGARAPAGEKRACSSAVRFLDRFYKQAFGEDVPFCDGRNTSLPSNLRPSTKSQ